MSLADDQAQLALVNQAINKILTGGVMSKSSNGSDGSGNSLTNLPLDQLTRMRDDLERRISRAQRGSGFSRARFLPEE